MTPAQLRAEIEAVLGEVDYPGPAALLPYAAAVRDALRVRLPKAQIEAFNRRTEFVAGARQDGHIVEVVIPLP